MTTLREDSPDEPPVLKGPWHMGKAKNGKVLVRSRSVWLAELGEEVAATESRWDLDRSDLWRETTTLSSAYIKHQADKIKTRQKEHV